MDGRLPLPTHASNVAEGYPFVREEAPMNNEYPLLLENRGVSYYPFACEP